MHTYATDVEERIRAPIWLAIASIVVAGAANWLLERESLIIPWYIETPAPLGLYGLMYHAYETRLWRYFKLSRIPDLGGTWRGAVKSQFEPGKTTATVIWIRQRWSSMAIDLETENSFSHSQMATLNVLGTRPELSYTYLNEPFPSAPDTMEAHRGVCQLTVETRDRMTGIYFTGRGRNFSGSIELTRVSGSVVPRTEVLAAQKGN